MEWIWCLYMNKKVVNKITKEGVLGFINSFRKPVFESELFDEFVNSTADIKFLNSIIDDLVTGGDIYKTKKNRYGIPSKMSLIFGVLMTTEKGFGFVRPKGATRADKADIFIPANSLNGAMNGDKVFVKIDSPFEHRFMKGKEEGYIESVVERNNKTIVGTLQHNKSMGFVVPDDSKISNDIFVSKANLGDAKDKQKVVVEIIKWAEKGRNPEGKIKEVLGYIEDEGVDILSVIRKYKLPESFNKKVLAEASGIKQDVDASDTKNRRDYRNKPVITIDGIDAKDLDDAVYLEKDEHGNYVLSVHIADVTNYVKEGNKIDKQAFKRGTSVYLIDRVIPMLPHNLSNGICSLNEGVDRLTLSIEMVIDKTGKVLKYDVFEGVIKTRHRLNYKEVTYLFNNKKLAEGSDICSEVQDMLFEMLELSRILRAKRRKRGSISFDFPESHIVLDENGVPVSIEERERGESNKLIEEFMLIANETVAEYMYWLELPFVYRVHENPDLEKIEDLNRYIMTLGHKIKIKDESVHPSELQKLIDDIDGEPYERMVSKLMLRSLRQARYSPECLGHFGLSARYYCHFTSPIRRYPDLEIHRIIKKHIHGEIKDNNLRFLEREVEQVSEQSSHCERIAESAEREVDDMKKCQFMLGSVGEEYMGVISSVTKNGIYTELENTVEGYTKVSELGSDYYEFVENRLAFVGEYTGQVFAIGDIVKIRVDAVDVESRRITFSILENTGKKERDKRTKPLL